MFARKNRLFFIGAFLKHPVKNVKREEKIKKTTLPPQG
jgi:hypothetical protein